MVAQGPFKPRVAGSNPAGGTLGLGCSSLPAIARTSAGTRSGGVCNIPSLVSLPPLRATAGVPVTLLEGVVSCYHDFVTRQTTVRLPDELADQADAVARVRGTSVNALIVESLTTAIDLVRADDDFTERARKLLERDKELLDRLAR